MKYTQIPDDTFEKLQFNAGIVVSSFTPATATIGDILFATTGGVQFNTNPTYEDFGADVDNCPDNTKELKKLVSVDPTLSGTALTVTAAVVAKLAGAAGVDATDTTKVVPKEDLESGDFGDIWWVGDYSDKNTGTTAGFIAIHLKRALNQNGFQLTTGKRAKGQFPFEFHGHYTIDDMSDVPYELYVKAGTASTVSTS